MFVPVFSKDVIGWKIARIWPKTPGLERVVNYDLLEMWKSTDSRLHPLEKRFFGYVSDTPKYRKHVTIFDSYEYAEMVSLVASSQWQSTDAKFALIPVY